MRGTAESLQIEGGKLLRRLLHGIANVRDLDHLDVSQKLQRPMQVLRLNPLHVRIN